MLKLSGCVITVISATLLFSRKVLENYYTYKFLDKAVQTIKQIRINLKSLLTKRQESVFMVTFYILWPVMLPGKSMKRKLRKARCVRN